VEPQVTVLMPVRNGAAWLQAAVDSILAQTFGDFEFLVIDDGSTDATPEILRGSRDPRVRVVTHPENLGLVPTLNEGLRLARGRFIARQDHDDLSYPERLAKQVGYLRAHPDCLLVGSEAFASIGDEARAYRLLRPGNTESIRWYLCFDNAFIHSAVMFRRDVLRDEFGGYPQSFHSEDYALWSRVAAERDTANLTEPLLAYREHAASVTGSMSPEAAASFDAATQEIRWRNLQALFGEEVTVEDARVLSTYRRDFSPASADEFLGVFDRLASIHAPRVRDAMEFQRIRAIQLVELAYRVLPLARWKALKLYLRAIALHSAIVTVLPWMRIGALLLLGERARAIYLALTRKG
jgi:glycosyltransferase involved in cell wall biosynthesis